MLQLKRVLFRKYVLSLYLVSSSLNERTQGLKDSHVCDMIDAQYRPFIRRSLVGFPLGTLFAHTRPSISKQSLRTTEKRACDFVQSQINNQSNGHLDNVRNLKLAVEVKVVPNTISTRALPFQGVCVSRKVLTIQDR